MLGPGGISGLLNGCAIGRAARLRIWFANQCNKFSPMLLLAACLHKNKEALHLPSARRNRPGRERTSLTLELDH